VALVEDNCLLAKLEAAPAPAYPADQLFWLTTILVAHGVFVRVLGQLLQLLTCAMLCSMAVVAQDKPMHQPVIQYGVAAVAAAASRQQRRALHNMLAMAVRVAVARQVARLEQHRLVAVAAQILARHQARAQLVKSSSLSSRRKERT
jgi:hypothetical protein